MITAALAWRLRSRQSRYTGKERDAESGLDNLGARYYASTMGRFLSPDWSAKVQPVPYAKLDNPQSLNLYAFVANNPLTLNPGAAAGTNAAPGLGANAGGAIQVVTQPGGVGNLWFGSYP